MTVNEIKLEIANLSNADIAELRMYTRNLYDSRTLPLVTEDDKSFLNRLEGKFNSVQEPMIELYPGNEAGEFDHHDDMVNEREFMKHRGNLSEDDKITYNL